MILVLLLKASSELQIAGFGEAVGNEAWQVMFALYLSFVDPFCL